MKNSKPSPLADSVLSSAEGLRYLLILVKLQILPPNHGHFELSMYLAGKMIEDAIKAINFSPNKSDQVPDPQV
jgi:hypothetical protein